MDPRPLDPTERMVVALDRAFTMNFAPVAQVRGPLPTARVQAGLAQLVLRHPLLSATLEGSGTRQRLVPGGARPIPLEERDAAPGEWIAASEELLVHRPWPAEGPRARCILLRHGPREATLLLGFDHVVSDGGSGMLVMRDLLRAMGTPEVALPEVPSPGQAAFYPPGHGGVGDLLRVAAYLARGTQTKPFRLRLEANAEASERRVRVLPFVADRATTAGLAARARAEGCTVHGLLSAALLFAITEARRADGRELPVRLMHALDMRRYLAERTGRPAPADLREACGYYVSSVDTTHSLGPSVDVLALAREVSAGVKAGKANGEPFVTAPGAGRIAARLGNVLEPSRWRRLAERHLLLYTSSISNLGVLERLDIPSTYGDLVLDDLSFVASPSALGTIMASASSFGGQLRFYLHHVEPLVSRDTAERVFARVVGVLNELAEGGPLKLDAAAE